MQFYRVYHIDKRGDISSLSNFSAADDLAACRVAEGLMEQHKSAGAEVWQCARQVHCAGLARADAASGFAYPNHAGG